MRLLRRAGRAGRSTSRSSSLRLGTGRTAAGAAPADESGLAEVFAPERGRRSHPRERCSVRDRQPPIDSFRSRIPLPQRVGERPRRYGDPPAGVDKVVRQSQAERGGLRMHFVELRNELGLR